MRYKNERASYRLRNLVTLILITCIKWTKDHIFRASKRAAKAPESSFIFKRFPLKLVPRAFVAPLIFFYVRAKCETRRVPLFAALYAGCGPLQQAVAVERRIPDEPGRDRRRVRIRVQHPAHRVKHGYRSPVHDRGKP